jgi:hypothetical protein
MLFESNIQGLKIVKNYYQNGINYRVKKNSEHRLLEQFLQCMTSTTTTIEPNFNQQSIKNV